MISLRPSYIYSIQNSLNSKGGFYIDWSKTLITPHDINEKNFEQIVVNFNSQESKSTGGLKPITKEIFNSEEYKTYLKILNGIGLQGMHSVKIANAGLPNSDTNDFDILCEFYGDLLAFEIKNKSHITDVEKQIKRGRALYLPIYFYFYEGSKLKKDFEDYVKTPSLSEVNNFGDYKEWIKDDLRIYNIERLYFIDHSKNLKKQFDIAIKINNKFKLGYTSCFIEEDKDFAEKYGFEVKTIKPK